MQIKFEILKKGETVLNVWENHIAVQKKSGEVEIYRFYLDEEDTLSFFKCEAQYVNGKDYAVCITPRVKEKANAFLELFK